MISITSNDHYADSQIVSPSVEFYPDPHDTYMSKLYLDNTSIFPSQLAKSTTPGAKTEQVAGATALTEAVRLIINQLQGKGMFWGPVPITIRTDEELDALETTGIYRLTTNITGATNPLHMAKNSILIVFGKESYNADQLEPPTKTFSSRNIIQMMFSAPASSSAFNVAAHDSVIYTRLGTASGDTAAISWQDWVAYNRRHRVITYDMRSNASGRIDLSPKETDNTHIVVVGNGETITVGCPDAHNLPHGKFQLEAVNTKILLIQQDPMICRWKTLPPTTAYWTFEAVTATSTDFLQLDSFKYFIKTGSTYTECDYNAAVTVGTTLYKQRFLQSAGDKYASYTNYDGVWPDFDVYYREGVAGSYTYIKYTDAYKAANPCPTGAAGLYTKQRSVVIDGTEYPYYYTNDDSPYPRSDAASLGTHTDWYTIRNRTYCYDKIDAISITLDSLAGDSTQRAAAVPGNTAEGERKFVSDRMLYPLESDGRAWYLIVAS